jgi:hypothetical protein
MNTTSNPRAISKRKSIFFGIAAGFETIRETVRCDGSIRCLLVIMKNENLAAMIRLKLRNLYIGYVSYMNVAVIGSGYLVEKREGIHYTLPALKSLTSQIRRPTLDL